MIKVDFLKTSTVIIVYLDPDYDTKLVACNEAARILKKEVIRLEHRLS